MQKILRNRARCLDCGTVIESQFLFDIEMCRCGAISLSGGKQKVALMTAGGSHRAELLTEVEVSNDL